MTAQPNAFTVARSTAYANRRCVRQTMSNEHTMAIVGPRGAAHLGREAANPPTTDDKTRTKKHATAIRRQ